MSDNICEHISRLREYLKNYRLEIHSDAPMIINCGKCGGRLTTPHPKAVVATEPVEPEAVESVAGVWSDGTTEIEAEVDEKPPVVQKFHVQRYLCKAGHEFVTPLAEGTPGPMVVACQNEVGGAICTELAHKFTAGTKPTVKYEGPIVS